MQTKTKIRSIGAALSLLILLTGCSENRVSPGVSAGSQSESETPISSTKKPSESEDDLSMPSSKEDSVESPVSGAENPSESEDDLSMPSSKENSVESPVNTDTVSINGDVMWGIGKTIDEVTAKYGSATAVGNNMYTYENGYGKYIFSGDCKTISEISARDFLVGNLSTVTLENFASKCGLEVVPLNDNDDPNTMYEGCRLAYYTHPSYDNITFVMLYKESGFDETATFDIRYNG